VLPDDKQKIESLVAELEEVIKAEDYTAMKAKTEELKKTVMEVGEKAYKEAGTGSPASDDVIETDFSAEK
jgi:hypothetical protein